MNMEKGIDYFLDVNWKWLGIMTDEDQMEGMNTEKLYCKGFEYWWRKMRDMAQSILVLREDIREEI